jgi:hypothetical protein
LCEDCAIQLVSGSPPARVTESSETGLLPEAKLVAVRTFDGPESSFEADLARNLLRASGIPSTLSGDMAAGLFPGFLTVLQVREEDATRAVRILEEYLRHDPDRATE